MEVLHRSFVWEWCREHGVELDEQGDRSPFVVEDPSLSHRVRVVFAPSGPVGFEAAVRDAVLGTLGAWDECLVWIT